jgi:peptide deformylase
MTVDPALLHVRNYPDPVLRNKAGPVKAVDAVVRSVALRMIELMRQHEGIGLAAPQVGLPWRMFVCDVPAADDRSPDSSPPAASRGPQVYINPVLSKPLGPPEPYEEGCLSIPDVRGEVLRPHTITIGALDLEGEPVSMTATGLLARCWQHEVDHLDGILIIDRMTQMSRLKNRSSIRDLERRSTDM